mgnify:FL=1
MTDEDADFLKRKNVFNSDVGLYFGALDEDSIFKSLHSVLRSKAVSNEEQCTSNIDGALREWFAHGREVYEKRRAQMNEVALRADLRHGCSQLDVTYDMALERFCDKYDITLDNQCGVEIPYHTDDHCIGSASDIYFWWEHIVADLSHFIMLLIAVQIHRGKLTFKVGTINTFCTFILLKCTGGFVHLWLPFVFIAISFYELFWLQALTELSGIYFRWALGVK